MKFDDLEQFSEADIQAAIARSDPEELKLVSLTLALACADPCSAQIYCVQLASHPDARVRGNAFLSLGHLARRFRTLDEPSVKPVIEEGLQDLDDSVRSKAKSAADEIHQFLHWVFAGHVHV